MHRTITIVSSSAGSGKTFTLVKEYLTLALIRPYHFKHILAITFTNKAANEMKTRIISYTRDIALGFDTDMARQLTIATGFSSHVLRERAQNLLTAILHEYYDFSVMTIDSFIIRIVRAFSLDLGLPHRYDIDMSRSALLRAAADCVIERFATPGSEEVSSLLLDFAAHKIREGKHWNISKDVYSAAKELFSENAEPYLQQLASCSLQALQKILSFHREQMTYQTHVVRKCARIVLEYIKVLGFSQDDFAHKSRGIVGVLTFIAEESISEKTIEKINHLMGMDPDNYCRSGSCNYSRCTLSAHRIARRIAVFMSYAEDAYRAYQSSRAVLDYGYTLGVLRSIDDALREYSREHKRIPISEFNRKVHELVRNEAVPFIYWRAGDTYASYLIDEFQDTSGRQWENIWPLIDEALATSHGDRSMLFVGDTKQAIYRWRGGNAEIMRTGIDAQIHKIGQSATRISLEKNYRSNEEIVDFNNKYFSFLRSYLKENDYIHDNLDSECIEQQSHIGVGGAVTVDVYEKGEDTAQKIILHISSLTQFSYGDHAILVRSKKEGSAIARALFDAGIPVVSPDSLRIDNDPAVQFILAMLRLLADPDDAIARTAAMRCHAESIEAGADAQDLLLTLDPEGVQNYCTAYIPREFHRLFTGQEIGKPDLWAGVTFSALPLSVYDTVEHILTVFELARTRKGGSAGYLQVFTDCVFSFSTHHRGTIREFLEWWDTAAEESPLSLALPESLNAVKVMTVHASKGLEFPSVIVPLNSGWTFTLKKGLNATSVWTNTDRFSFTNTVNPNTIPYFIEYTNKSDYTYFADDFHKEAVRTAIDTYNILYVAFTRACTQLHVLCETELSNEGALKPTAAGITAHGIINGDIVVTQTKSCFEKKNKKDCTVEIPYKSYQWHDSVRIARRGNRLWPGNQRLEKIQFGIAVHEALSRINKSVAADRACASVLRDGFIDHSSENTLYHAVSTALTTIIGTTTLFDCIIAPGTQKERAILTQSGILRPDCVAVFDSKIIVIDYKTGVPSSAHHTQLTTYSLELCHLYMKPVEAYILYIGENGASVVEMVEKESL